jgi:Bifunctional DNA primase/polymerase, N-terminal/YspA, cpYpsA-related SLOG family
VTDHTCLRVRRDDPDANSIGIGAMALRYAQLGLSVIPLARGAKRPHRILGDHGGVWHATTDPGWIRWWWGSDPAASIGIACGQASRLIVIDLDTKHGQDGYAGWDSLLRAGTVIPAAEHRRTGPGRRVTVTGSRTWNDWQAIATGLGEEWGEGDAVLVSGACPRGADAMAEKIWASWGGRIERHPADWRTGRGAGFARNTAMARSGVDVCLAFIRDGSSGATHAAGEAQTAGVPVRWHTSPLPLPAGQLSAATPSGGQHLYFRPLTGWPVPNKNGLLPGVDVKGDGGYVVAAPSRVTVDSIDPAHGSGAVMLPYRWETGCLCSIPPMPEWMAGWTTHTAGQASNSGSAGAGGADLAAAQEHGLDAGERNVQLHRLACRAYGRHGTTPFGHEQVMKDLGPVLEKTSRQGFSQHEIETILASARKWVEDQRSADAAGPDYLRLVKEIFQ